MATSSPCRPASRHARRTRWSTASARRCWPRRASGRRGARAGTSTTSTARRRRAARACSISPPCRSRSSASRCSARSPIPRTPRSPCAPWLAPFEPYKESIVGRLKPFGWRSHLLGTDELGRDMVTRLLYGGRVSLVVGGGPVLIASRVGGVGGGDRPVPWVPRRDRDPQDGVGGTRQRRLVREHLQGLRGDPPHAARGGRRPAASPEVQEVDPLVTPSTPIT